MRQVMRLPEREVRPQVEARVTVFGVPLDPTVDVLTALGPIGVPSTAEQ